MTASAVGFHMDQDHLVHSLQQAIEQLDHGGGEMVLDFSSVQRIDPSALEAMEDLAGMAEGKTVKLVLQDVNVAIYKVLKLAKLTSRFSFRAGTGSV
jgi:anti-anti-sigma regulatory factor